MTRRLLIGAGALIMAYAVGGAFFDHDVDRIGVPLFLISVIVLHDGLFLPVVIGGGALIGRFVAPRWRNTVRLAALVSLPVTVVAMPFVLGYGRRPDNPSALPLAYGRGLLVIVGLIWGLALGRKGFARWRARRGG